MEILTKIKEAISLAKAGNFHAAENIYTSLLAKHPDDIRVLPFLGWLYIAQQNYSKAIEAFLKINNKTENINVITGLGLCYFEQRDYEKAYYFLKKSADTTPTLDILYKLITCACENSNQTELIFNYAEKMKTLYPNSQLTWDAYILAALCAGKFDIAESYCQELLIANPSNATLYLSAGLIQEVIYLNYELALECYLKSYELSQTTSALYNIGLAYARLNKFKEAEKYLLKSLEKSTNSVEINKSLYILYASNKIFDKAYNHFKKSADVLLKKLNFNWDGNSYINETLYILGDQGLGDIIMYSRYLPYVKQMFKHVIVAINPSLINLFSSNKFFENIKFVDYKEPIKYDKSTILTMLPKLLNMDYHKIPMAEGYLTNTNQILDNNLFNTQKLKIGIIWEAGGTKLRGSLDRTINPKLLKPLFEIPNTEIYSLQVNPSMDIKQYYDNITDLGALLRDFEYTADAISKMDLIITVDTSVAHLAGAMGKITYLMLPYYCDWRWFNNTENTEWYNSVKIFKQPSIMDWATVINNIQTAIEAQHLQGLHQ